MASTSAVSLLRAAAASRGTIRPLGSKAAGAHRRAHHASALLRSTAAPSRAAHGAAAPSSLRRLASSLSSARAVGGSTGAALAPRQLSQRQQRRGAAVLARAIAAPPRESWRLSPEVAKALGFEEVSQQFIEEYKANGVLDRHSKTGAEIMSVSCEDENKVFGIVFRTPRKSALQNSHTRCGTHNLSPKVEQRPRF